MIVRYMDSPVWTFEGDGGGGRLTWGGSEVEACMTLGAEMVVAMD